jgi:dihydroxy-acid dehydratase
MGTAATMTALAEAMGMTLPGASSIPAADSNHLRMAMETGHRAVEMVFEDLKPSDILTCAAFRNAIAVDMAIAGSTNAIIHLVAMARRRGIEMPLRVFDEISARVPVLANIRPSGEFLMEDFYYAGGLRALMAQITDLLDGGCRTVNGKTLGENLEGARIVNREVIHGRDAPLSESGGTAVLSGSLAPDGAVIKTSAADRRFLTHTGRAVVFENYRDLDARIHREDLDVDESSILVLRNAGPLGGPGMPEWGMLPIPKKLLQRGVRDMVRISDARMSGTSYGTCVLHVSPESYVGGPLALVQSGDLICLDVPGRRLDLLVSEEELAARGAKWVAPKQDDRGYLALYRERVTQAHLGCDFDFLAREAPPWEPDIF